jgi:hypothetical protein
MVLQCRILLNRSLNLSSLILNSTKIQSQIRIISLVNLMKKSTSIQITRKRETPVYNGDQRIQETSKTQIESMSRLMSVLAN